MIVPHALLRAQGVPALWAETDDVEPNADPGDGSPWHPFAPSAGTLTDHLGVAEGNAEIGSVSLVLPSRSSRPEPSPDLRGESTAARRAAPRLKAWQVPVITPVGVDLGRLLTAAGPASASIRYLLDVVGFATDLVDRGRVLPSVTREPAESVAARWKPALFGVDRTRFTALSEAMPAVCRAEQVRRRRLDGGDAHRILSATLDVLVDDVVRDRLARRAVALHHSPSGSADALGAWWNALIGRPQFDVPTGVLDDLTARLDRWCAELERQSPVRTCFRLRSPDQNGESEDWRLEILMQAVSDPSVLVPAEEVWADRGSVLHRWLDYPDRQLLADLGRACALHPALSTGLDGPRPTGMTLDVAGAYDFLTRAESLTEAGFAVLLPKWWRRPGELSFRVSTTSTATAGIAAREPVIVKDEIVNCRWNIALGNEILSESELAQLAAAKVPLVQVRGQWACLDADRLAAGLAFLEGKHRSRMHAGELLLATGPRADETPLPIAEVSGTGWLADLLSGNTDTRLREVDTPADLVGELRPYQRRGLAWLAFLDRLGFGACLADDMGLGKTIQLLALELLCRAETPRPPTLVVCPVSVLGNWCRETSRFAPTLSVHVHHGPERLSGAALQHALAGHDLVITTYSVVTKDIDELSIIDWDRVVLDEAQTIKNSGTRVARTIRRLHARHRLALTGTPVENRLAELWSVLDFANPGLLGSAGTFRARFAVPIERYHDQDAAMRLRTATRPFVLRRTKSDPLIAPDLPSKIEVVQPCNLTAEQATLYRAVVDDMLTQIQETEGMQRRGLVLAAMSKLKQVCNHPAHLLGDESDLTGRSGKLTRIEEVVEQVLDAGDRVLCFTQFVRFGSMLQRHLAARFGTEVLFLHGSLTQKAREVMIARSQAPDGPPILLVSLKAGGTGLNLTAANHVIHLDRWWNPAVEDQATDRAFRIGQARTVHVRKMLCVGTIEEKIHKLMLAKSDVARWAVGSGDEWLTELSVERLAELVTLSPEATDD